MASDPFDRRDRTDRTQLWPNVMSILILAVFSLTLLAWSPWGFELPSTALSLFFKLFPLTVLGALTYVATEKLADEETEIP